VIFERFTGVKILHSADRSSVLVYRDEEYDQRISTTVEVSEQWLKWLNILVTAQDNTSLQEAVAQAEILYILAKKS
jgi:hypothetical protein